MAFLPQRQLVFPDGSSSDVTMEATLQSAPKENVRTEGLPGPHKSGFSSAAVCLLSLQLTEASMFIYSGRSDGGRCRRAGGTFNPFNMTLMVRPLTSPSQLISNFRHPVLDLAPQSAGCSPEKPLSCAVGEISTRQGASSLAGRRVSTDSSIDLAGDFTGKRRANDASVWTA